jgi:plastocyanin
MRSIQIVSMDTERMTRRRALQVGAVGISGTLAGCLGGDDPGYDIGMTAVAFLPQVHTIDAGESVTWRNTSSRGHTVTAYDDAIPAGDTFFASGGFEDTASAETAFSTELGGMIGSSEEYEHRFDVPGRYEYYCIPHEQAGMVGTITVE